MLSDFECDVCQENSVIYNDLFEKYKDKVKFGFSNFASYVSLPAIASECAAKQNKFWEFHDTLFTTQNNLDTVDLIRIAKILDLDIDIFKKDLISNEISSSIQQNIENLSNYGIYATPTILINNRPIFNSSSIEEIEGILLAELEKL